MAADVNNGIGGRVMVVTKKLQIDDQDNQSIQNNIGKLKEYMRDNLMSDQELLQFSNDESNHGLQIETRGYAIR